MTYHISKICIFTLVIVMIYTRSSLSSRPWPHATLNASIENFVSEHKSGSVFVVQGQKIIKLSDRFEILGSSFYENVKNNRILHLLQSSQQDFLLSCWQPQELQCTLSEINSFNESAKLFSLSKSKNLNIGENDRVRVTSIRSEYIDFLIATSRLAPVESDQPTTQPSSLDVPLAIGRFKIDKDLDWFSKQVSVLSYKKQLSGENLIFEYIYAFNYNQYTYFILNDRWDSRQRVRLARICDSDNELTSYAEITMACNKKDNIMAKYAFFDSEKDEPTLHVAFEYDVEGRSTRKGTLLCAYEFNFADAFIQNAVLECNRGSSDLSLLGKFDLVSGQPCQRNPSKDFCTSKLNPYINGTTDKYKVTTDKSISIEGMISVNFLYLLRQGSDEKEVFFIGTESGHLTKLTEDENLLYSIDFPKSAIKSYHKENKYFYRSTQAKFSKTTRYAIDSQGIVAVSDDGRLDRIDPHACYYYTSCDSCLNSKDPLECVWCDDACSRKQNCKKSKRSTISCPPYILDFEPKSGPLSGSNLIKIEGGHFGSAKGSRTVKVGVQTCEINNDSSNDTTIICTIPQVNSTQNASISVEVSDVLDGLDLKGNTTAKDPYIYVEAVEEIETGTSVILIFTIFIVFIIVIVLCFSHGAEFSHLKEKIWPPIKLKGNDGAEVTYRNSQPTAGLAGHSINELVKLNGSIMSSDNYFVNVDQSPIDQPLMNNLLDNDLLSLLRQENILIDRKLLTLGHVLGSGQFGRVYKGFLLVEETGEHVAVAVKTIHNRSMWDDALDDRAFVEEGLMMKDFEHENVLTLIGVTVDSSGLPMVVTPFMLYGDLRSYISDEASSPTVRELIDFGTQIAKGMAYLANLKFVHRDLAARNCMLDENLTVKVADFGLSRDIYERDYYSSENKKTKLPVKWMAIESLERCIYSTKTDVWSYGVLLWELMTRGVVPYPDVDNFDLFSYLKEGRRMMRPRYCPEILYGIMLSCWQENPNDRPTFDELVERVSAVITNLQIAKDGQQTVSRDETYCDAFKRPM